VSTCSFFLLDLCDFLPPPSRLIHPTHPTVSLARSIFPARSLDLVPLLSSHQVVTPLCKVDALRSSCATCCFFLLDLCNFLSPPSRLIGPTHPTVSLARSIFPARSLDLVPLLSSHQVVTALCKVAALRSYDL
jgi:hypothetical protein